MRIDFFGDEIESMRKFDPETQRSSSPVDEITLLPLTETPVTEKLLGAVHARLVRGGTAGADLEGGEEPREMQTNVGNVSVFPGWEFFAPVAGAHSTILDLMGPKTRVIVEEPAMVKNQGERWWNKIEQRHDRSGIGNLVKPDDIYLSPWDLDDRVRMYPGIDLDQLGAVDVLDPEQVSQSEIEFASRPTMRFHGSIPAFTEQLKTLQQQDARVLIAAANQGEVERLAGLLQEYGVAYRIGSRVQQASGSATVYDETSYLTGDIRTPVIVKTALANGVQFLDLEKATARQLIVFGAQDLNDEADVHARPVQRKSKTSAFISDFRDLTVGDFVVHVEHGIAKYMGLRTIDQDGAPLELMILEFAEQAKLYVPLTRLDLIQKYRSSEAGPAPELNKMGGAAWAKTKARVKKAMQDMTGELLKLYAQRQAAMGYAYSPDSQMMREFEDAFDYNETDDQLAAIADIKRDMESTQPMDRLAVRRRGLRQDRSGHARRLQSRAGLEAGGRSYTDNGPELPAFPVVQKTLRTLSVTVEMISSFRTAKEQKKILEDTAAGKVDILIGTHRLLSKDIAFQDLGLLVVDEEQRFGVRHKERLKQMRAHIDVLAMSATPIPRTLHMSLLGLRDMSVIETPPKDRMAIQTIVAKFDEKLLRTAIEMELERNGQVYFVHNRVETIYELASKVRELVPQARVVTAHGQMGEGELEKAMLAFMNYEFDVLCATSIIENGLDIPLANTIIINRADRHGLSELYQLRGRVGRSNRRAYSLSADPSRAGTHRDRAPPPGRPERVQRPGRWLQDRRARPRVARRGQHAWRRTERTHRSHRLRDVHQHAAGGGRQDQGRSTGRAAGRAA